MSSSSPSASSSTCSSLTRSSKSFINVGGKNLSQQTLQVWSQTVPQVKEIVRAKEELMIQCVLSQTEEKHGHETEIDAVLVELKNQPVGHLDLDGSYPTAISSVALLSIGSFTSLLQTLILDRNLFDSTTSQLLPKVLSNNFPLDVFSCNECHLDAKTMGFLLTQAKASKSLTTLSVSGNSFDSTAVAILGEVIAQVPLKSLSCDYCNFNDQAMSALLTAAQTSKTLTSLSAFGNANTEPVADAFLKMLNDNNSLTSVNLSPWQISTEQRSGLLSASASMSSSNNSSAVTSVVTNASDIKDISISSSSSCISTLSSSSSTQTLSKTAIKREKIFHFFSEIMHLLESKQRLMWVQFLLANDTDMTAENLASAEEFKTLKQYEVEGDSRGELNFQLTYSYNTTLAKILFGLYQNCCHLLSTATQDNVLPTISAFFWHLEEAAVNRRYATSAADYINKVVLSSKGYNPYDFTVLVLKRFFDLVSEAQSTNSTTTNRLPVPRLDVNNIVGIVARQWQSLTGEREDDSFLATVQESQQFISATTGGGQQDRQYAQNMQLLLKDAKASTTKDKRKSTVDEEKKQHLTQAPNPEDVAYLEQFRVPGPTNHYASLLAQQEKDRGGGKTTNNQQRETNSVTAGSVIPDLQPELMRLHNSDRVTNGSGTDSDISSANTDSDISSGDTHSSKKEEQKTEDNNKGNEKDSDKKDTARSPSPLGSVNGDEAYLQEQTAQAVSSSASATTSTTVSFSVPVDVVSHISLTTGDNSSSRSPSAPLPSSSSSSITTEQQQAAIRALTQSGGGGSSVFASRAQDRSTNTEKTSLLNTKSGVDSSSYHSTDSTESSQMVGSTGQPTLYHSPSLCSSLPCVIL